MVTRLHLTPRDHGRRLTLAEFQHARSREGYHYELINGKLEVWPSPELPHDFLRCWLREKWHECRENHSEALQRICAPAQVFVPGCRRTTAAEPDVAAYRDFPTDLPVAQLDWRDVSPLLVVEVVSEDTADKDLVRNPPLYLRVPSIREYWILDPRADADRPSLLVYRRRGARWQRPLAVAGGRTYTTRLLPGFTLVLDVRAEGR
jgi:Uma2 family endonuclease